MKILIANDGPCAFYYIRLGLARAFSACGHEVQLWDMTQIPTTKVFDSFEPDLFLGQTYNTNRVLCDMIKERPHMKVIMKAGDWGKSTDEIKYSDYGMLAASQNEIKTILDLYEETQKPDYLDIYYHPDYIEYTHGYWVQNGITMHSHLLASDIFEYTKGQKQTEYESDVTFIGGYWAQKSKTLNKYLLPLCNDFRYKIKIFGNSLWPVPQYCGYVNNEEVRHVLSSATICPQLHEPHSQDFGFDVSERTFKLLSNKCFVVSDYVEGLHKLIPKGIVYATDPKEFADYIAYFVENPDKRLEYIQNGYEEVMNNHTYFHRVRDIFNNLKLYSHARHCEEVYNNIKENL
jgi:hypothetical protein